jgi:hypothetical protein
MELTRFSETQVDLDSTRRRYNLVHLIFLFQMLECNLFAYLFMKLLQEIESFLRS